MNILGGLGNLDGIGKLLDPGAIVKDVVNSVLPKNLGVAGDLAGAFVDFKMGNPIGALQHAMEAVKDLPQAAKGLQGSAPSGPLLRQLPPGLEPSPPPLDSRAGKPFDWNELVSAIKALTAALTAHQSPGAGTASTEIAKPAPADSRAAAPATAPPAATSSNTSATPATPTAPRAPAPATTPASSTPHEPGASSVTEAHYRRESTTLTWVGEPRTVAPETASWVGAPRTPAPATTTPTAAASSSSPAAGTNPPATAAAASTPPPTAAATPGTAATPPPGAGQTITSISQLQEMSDRAVRDAVINGRIAPEVAKDPTAMMAIQQRMNAISEMNNLMTAMMRAVHDMQMAIIQNIRI